LRKSLTSDSLMLMIGRGLGFIISLVVPFFLVRIFSVQEYGEYRQFFLIASMASTILPLGMTQSLYYFFPHYPEKKGVYLSRTIFVTMLAGLAFGFALCVFPTQVAAFFKNEAYVKYSYILGFVSLVYTLSLFIETVLIVEKRVVYSSVVLVSSRIVRGVAILLGSYYGGVIGALIGIGVHSASRVLFSFAYFRRNYAVSLKSIKFRESGEQFRYALPLAIGGFSSYFLDSLDKLMVSHSLGVQDFAVYAVGCYEIPFLLIVFQSIGDVILPRIVELKKNNQIKELTNLWHTSIESSILIGAPIFIFCFVFAGSIVTTLFTEKYIHSTPIFRISIFTILLESTRYGTMTRSFAKTWFSLMANSLAALSMFPLCLLGINYWGLVGGIAGAVLAKTLYILSELIYSKHLLKLDWTNFFPVKVPIYSIGVSLVAGAMTYVVQLNIAEINKWIKMGILGTLYCLLYAILANRIHLWKIDSLPVPSRLRSILRMSRVLV
jgi:O-antigen/teichoic acid export membrane protein